MAITDDRLAVIQPLNKFWYQNKVAALDMLRLDRLHEVVSGNKWYKLRLNLLYAQEKHLKTIVTFGGGYSNHLVATAYAAQHYGLASVGIVRGRYDELTPTLRSCKEYGMELLFVTQEDYNNKHQPGWAEELVRHFDEIYIIPEGGANQKGRDGAALINRFIDKNYSHVVLAVGTGTTMAGILQDLSPQQKVMGFVPMKEHHEQEHYLTEHLPPSVGNWQLFSDHHFAGFGRWNNTLLDFMNDFYRENNIPLDVVYTGKMMYNLHAMLMENEFSSCDRVLCIHSGGLQGNVSVREKLIY